MKKFNATMALLASITAAFMAGNAQAQANGLVFPPSEAEQTLQYPPQSAMQPAPGYGQRPQQQPYVFGQQAPVAPPSPYYAAPIARPPTSFNGYPTQQRPVQQPGRIPPSGIPGRSYPTYPPVYGQRNNSNFPFANNMPFGNSNGNYGNSGFNPFSNGNMPFSGNSFGMPSNPMNSFFGNNNSKQLPFFKQSKSKRKKAWGDERNIWPDFYTDFTDDAWDTVMSGPRDLGRMPGGWRFPYISMPDPVTVSDAVVNQFPPIAEEAGNMADVSDWGVFENKK